MLKTSEWAEHAREILRQYNGSGYSQGYNHGGRFQEPHFVVFHRGDFRLIPYGAYADERYVFECRPEIVSWQSEPLWPFVVR